MRESTPSAPSLPQDTLIVIADDVFLRSGLGLTQTVCGHRLVSVSPAASNLYSLYLPPTLHQDFHENGDNSLLIYTPSESVFV